MSDKSPIEWTDATWNPVSGCDRVSPGCANCYAVPLAHRFQSKEKFSGLTVVQPNGKLNWTGLVKCHEEELLKPLSWKKPRKIFVNSMADTFHKDVPFEFLDEMFAMMAICHQHTFQVLTKRPERAVEYFANLGSRLYDIQAAGEGIASLQGWCHAGEDDWELPLKNVWIGTSVENQQTADERISRLLQVPSVVRFLSCEPLLGPLNLSAWLQEDCPDCEGYGGGRSPNWHDDGAWICSRCEGSGQIPNECSGIEWVITGGESGPGARPMHPDWPRSLRRQCKDAGVPFHFKQHGEWANYRDVGGNGWHSTHKVDGKQYGQITHWTPEREIALFDGKSFETQYPWMTTDSPGDCMVRVGKKNAGRLLDGVEHNGFPEVTHA